MAPKRGRARRDSLVVVHWLGDQAASWQEFKAAVEPRFEVVTCDLPGHGQAAPADDYRYAALVESVASATRGIDRFALLGHSVGGAVAWLFAARHPERINALILVEPAPPHQSPFIHGPTPESRHPKVSAASTVPDRSKRSSPRFRAPAWSRCVVRRTSFIGSIPSSWRRSF